MTSLDVLYTAFAQSHDVISGPRRRWEENIRIDLKIIAKNTRNFIDSAHDRDYWRALANAALNLRVP